MTDLRRGLGVQHGLDPAPPCDRMDAGCVDGAGEREVDVERPQRIGIEHRTPVRP